MVWFLSVYFEIILYKANGKVEQQYHVVLFRISPLGLDLGLGQRASWAFGAWVVHGIGHWHSMAVCLL